MTGCAGRSRGCHGRGGRGGRDGRGRGGDRGQGRGGRGGTTFNGVDVSDHTYNFTDAEITAMGREGRDNVFECRNRDKISRGRGGQGGGGKNADYNQPYDNSHSGQDQRQISQATGNNAPTADNTNGQSETQIVKFQSGPPRIQQGTLSPPRTRRHSRAWI